MKSTILAGAAFLSLAFAASANATTYDFSYLGLDGHTFAGSFTGTQSGSVVDVTGVNNVSFDGQSFTGPLSALSYIAGPGGGCTSNCYASGGAVVSLTNPLADNFLFIGPGNPASNYFYVIPWSNGAGNPTAVQGVFAGTPYDNYNGEFIPANLTVSAVPEPSIWIMMLGGMGIIGGLLRIAKDRRRERRFASVATA